MGLTIFSAFMESWANLMGEDGNPLNCKVRPEGQRGAQRRGRLGEADSSVHVGLVSGAPVHENGLDSSKRENASRV